MNNVEIISKIPEMLSGKELISAMESLPEYDEKIIRENQSVRLMALNDIYNIYVPSSMSTEIYSKLYLALLRSLQKKGTRVAIKQRYENHKAIKAEAYEGIIGGSDSFTIIGCSGIGKSSAISRAITLLTENRMIEIEKPYMKIIPCMSVQCPFDSSVKGLLIEILRKVDEELHTEYYTNAVKNRITTDMLIGVVSQVALNHIGLLIVDEIQNVVNSKNGKSLIGSLTQLINNSGISICMVGTPECTVFFEQAMQLARRSLGLRYNTLLFDDYFVEFCKTVFSYQYVQNKTEITDTIIEWLYEHNTCVDEVYQYWYEGKEDKLTQLLFCDLSTPKTDGSFSVYNDVRDKLIKKGIPSEEIAFIHHANTEVQKKELFSKVRHGAVRILMGSTSKMGAGTNVQNLIIASHDLDCPWRPRDLEQRAGRSIRRGNQNKKVSIVRYVTEGTFDAYLYQIIENKQKFISQIMTSKSPARTVEDIDEVALSYAEIKALATGKPYIKEKMDLDIQVSKLQLLKQSFFSQRYEMEDKATKQYPMEIKHLEERIAAYQEDVAQAKAFTPADREVFPPMQINGMTYTEKLEAGKAIVEACKAMKSPDEVKLGIYCGMKMALSYNTFSKEFVIALKGKLTHNVPLGTDIHGNITRLDNEIARFEDNLERCKERLENTKTQLETAKIEAQKPFPKEQELVEKTARLGELNALLDMDKKDKVVLDEEPEESKRVSEKSNRDRER